MSWRYRSDDEIVEAVVETEFRGDLTAMAASRVVWIVDSDSNRPLIDAVRATGNSLNLCEVNRYSVGD